MKYFVVGATGFVYGNKNGYKSESYAKKLAHEKNVDYYYEENVEDAIDTAESFSGSGFTSR